MDLPYEISYGPPMPTLFELTEPMAYTRPCFTREDVIARLPSGDFSHIPGFDVIIDGIVESLNSKDFYEELMELKNSCTTKETNTITQEHEQERDDTTISE